MGKVPRADAKAAHGGSPAKKKKKSKSIKSQIRGIERLLRKDDLPPPVRESQERMLAMLKGDHQDNQRQIKEQRMQKKYRMVRFFEKRKLLRRIQQCNSKLQAASAGNRSALEEKLAELQTDYNYVQHFPKGKKYISLLSEDQTGKTVEEKARIRQSIAADVATGKLPNAGLARCTQSETEDSSD